MNSPVVSVVVPVYNSAGTLKRCVDSILRQTFADWELVLVDNGSTDNSFDLIRKLAETDKRIRVLQELHSGVAWARNAALDIIRGEYVCFVDSDDYVENDYLEQMTLSPNADLTVCGYFIDTENVCGKKCKSDVRTTEIAYWNAEGPKSCLIKAFETGFMHLCCNKLFRCELIERHHMRFKHYPVNEDYIFTLTFLRYAESVSVIDIPLYHWIRVEGAVSGVKAIPCNLLDIYNESHLATREFFGDNLLADSIAYLSYEMIIYKYYEAIRAGRISKRDVFIKINELIHNGLVKETYNAYRPKAAGEKVLFALMKMGLYRAHYFLSQKIL